MHSSAGTFSISLARLFLIAAMIVPGDAVQAMDIKDYFKMADEDQVRFGLALLDGAERALRSEGREDLALQMNRLFNEVKSGSKISEGTYEYLSNLDDMLRSEVKREARNANSPHLQAERAFRDVAADHGINLPPQFEASVASFRPQLLLRDLANENKGQP